MLKVHYHSDGVRLERLTTSIESFIRQRTIFALRTGQSIHITKGYGTLLLPTTQGIEKLKTLVCAAETTQIRLKLADQETTEVCLDGIWVSETPSTESGILISSLNGPQSDPNRHLIERMIYQLWVATEIESQANL
jgi:hypothetical protein